MNPTRRQLLTTLAGAGVFSPNVAVAHRRRVSQRELDAAIANHATWLEDGSRGARAEFSRCDLSGLDFGAALNALVNLRGSDFTGADLTGATGGAVSFLRSSLHGAHLSWSHLKSPMFSYASLRGAVCDNAVWGWNDRQMSNPARPSPAEGADFQHTDAGGGAVFTWAAIRGLFVEAKFCGANLKEADFSYSRFYGARFSETSFFAANLTQAKFNFADISAARFREAKLIDTDFTNADIAYDVKFPEGIIDPRNS
jgi:uncharacterized protein YjbI with pentapeptide repeats